jgi:hypothetical protein
VTVCVTVTMTFACSRVRSPSFFVSNLDVARSSEHPETSCSETILHSYSPDISAVISEVSTQCSEL